MTINTQTSAQKKPSEPLILAVDSTAKVASAAITRGTRLMYTATSDTGYTHSETLLPMIESMLSILHLSISDIGLFACSAGPGSFTGVRIGAAVIKGLAFGTDVPCVSVSSLEALAQNISPFNGILCPSMDARRGQLYNALFRCSGTSVERLTPDRAISIEDLSTELAGFKGEKIYLSGDAYDLLHDALIGCGINPEPTPELLRRQNAYSVAACAYNAYLRGKTVTDSDLEPVYLRLPQAERERLERERKTN